MSLLGVIVCAISVGMFKLSALGVDPFQAFMAGLHKTIPMDFGTLYMITNVVLLLFSIITDRHNIGIATFINLFLLGYITDFTLKTLQETLGEITLIQRFIFLLVAIVVICIGSAFYMTADLGVSTYDAVAIVISGKWKRGRFKYVRICTDLICVILGIALFVAGGGEFGAVTAIVGVGTIITAFFMGPLIEFFNEKLARPFLNKDRGQ